MHYRGTQGDDDYAGTSGGDRFNMAQGGDDTVSGGAGKDIFGYGATLTAADRIDGGDGHDIVRLQGDYSGAHALVFAADTMVNVEVLQLRGAFDYDLTVNDATVAAGQTFLVDASALGAGNSVRFDASADTDGFFKFIGGAGDDVLTGSAWRNSFDLSLGGNDSATGGAKNDAFIMGAALGAADHLDGGAGLNTVELAGDYGDAGTSSPFEIDAAMLTNIQAMQLSGNFDYDLKFDGGIVASGTSFTIAAHGSRRGEQLRLRRFGRDAGPLHRRCGAGTFRPDRRRGRRPLRARQFHRRRHGRRRRGRRRDPVRIGGLGPRAVHGECAEHKLAAVRRGGRSERDRRHIGDRHPQLRRARQRRSYGGCERGHGVADIIRRRHGGTTPSPSARISTPWT